MWNQAGMFEKEVPLSSAIGARVLGLFSLLRRGLGIWLWFLWALFVNLSQRLHLLRSDNLGCAPNVNSGLDGCLSTLQRWLQVGSILAEAWRKCFLRSLFQLANSSSSAMRSWVGRITGIEPCQGIRSTKVGTGDWATARHLRRRIFTVGLARSHWKQLSTSLDARVIRFVTSRQSLSETTCGVLEINDP